MWIKVWQRWAHGEHKDLCDYHEVATEQDALELICDIDSDYGWSDKYRGAKYEIIDLPPIRWFEIEIECHKEAAAHNLRMVKKYKKLLEKALEVKN